MINGLSGTSLLIVPSHRDAAAGNPPNQEAAQARIVDRTTRSRHSVPDPARIADCVRELGRAQPDAAARLRPEGAILYACHRLALPAEHIAPEDYVVVPAAYVGMRPRPQNPAAGPGVRVQPEKRAALPQPAAHEYRFTTSSTRAMSPRQAAQWRLAITLTAREQRSDTAAIAAAAHILANG